MDNTLIVALFTAVGTIIGLYLQAYFNIIKRHKLDISKEIARRQEETYSNLLTTIWAVFLTGGESPTKRTKSLLDIPEEYAEWEKALRLAFFSNQHLLDQKSREAVRNLIRLALWIDQPGYEQYTYEHLKNAALAAAEALESGFHKKFHF